MTNNFKIFPKLNKNDCEMFNIFQITNVSIPTHKNSKFASYKKFPNCNVFNIFKNVMLPTFQFSNFLNFKFSRVQILNTFHLRGYIVNFESLPRMRIIEAKRISPKTRLE